MNTNIECKIHSNSLVTEICLHPNCEFNYLLCGKCRTKSRHFKEHKNSMVSIKKFLENCNALFTELRKEKKPNLKKFS